MPFAIVRSRHLRKAIKKYRESGRKQILEAAEEAIQLLAMQDAHSLLILRGRWQDHALKGDRSGFRELHLAQDDLLLYKIDYLLYRIEVVDIVNHEELRKKK